jgi:predicted  nucleic acid-binding Zn-ribbon protein
MAIDSAVLQQERTRLQNEVQVLGTKIATLSGEINAHLKALGITEADVEKETKAAQDALQKAGEEFNLLYEQYTQYKAQIAGTQAPATNPFQA